MRISIAGIQEKLPIIYEDGIFYLPLGSAASNCIIKPAIDGYDFTVDNEIFCMVLALEIGLPTAKVEKLELNDRDYIIIERYDRVSNTEAIIRLHQEDLCQIKKRYPEQKYQADGGPNYKDLFETIRKYSADSSADIESVIRIAIFNYIIGNTDAHGKNFSFLYTDKGFRLAPFYDLLSTEVYGNHSKKMAMKIGNTYDSEAVCLTDWHKFSRQNGITQEKIEKELKYISRRIFPIINVEKKRNLGFIKEDDINKSRYIFIDRIIDHILERIKKIDLY